MDTNQRKIAMAMVVVVIFSLIKNNTGSSTNHDANVRIFLGAGVATAILEVMADLGEGAAELAWGLALIAMLASVFIAGGSVWETISKAVGASTGTTSKTTTTTTGATAA